MLSAARSGEGGEGILKVLLAAGADPNYNNGEAVVAATRSAFVANLELLLGLWADGHSQVCLLIPYKSSLLLTLFIEDCIASNIDSRPKSFLAT